MGAGKKGDEPPAQSTDVESTDGPKLPYPKSVFFILTTEFCERFSYYGMRAILTLFLKNVLKFNEDTATVIYHAFTMFAYFTPLFGGMIADSLLGKFRTIFYLSVVYVVGNVVLSLGATPPLGLPDVAFSMIGLVLIAIGTGGIKPCVSAFGGDQFQLPQQEVQLAGFFSIFYAAINSGSLISTFITPIFRKDIKCFGDDTCYPLAFGVPAVLMLVALIVFLAGSFMYKKRKPTGNVITQVFKTVGHAISRKRKSKGDKREHWLDYADDKYGKRNIEDVKILLQILLLYIPLPFFWSLFDQQGSRWTFQASRMDGDLGGFVLKPDQMQVVNPILVLAFIPIFDKGIYPLLAKCNILKKPLQRLVMGGVFAGLAFVISGFVEIELQKTYPVELETGQSHLNFVNMISSEVSGSLVHADSDYKHDFKISTTSNYIVEETVPMGKYSVMFSSETDPTLISDNIEFELFDKHALSIMLVEVGGKIELVIPEGKTDDEDNPRVGDQLEKSGEGNPYVSILQYGLWTNPDPDGDGVLDEQIVRDNFAVDVVLRNPKKEKQYELFSYTGDEEEGSPEKYTDWRSTPALEIDTHNYEVWIEYQLPNGDGSYGGEMNKTLVEGFQIEPLSGGSYVLSIVNVNGNVTAYYSIVTQPNTFHMLWLLPQYIVMTMGEIMFSITIMDFSYTQAPKSMKSVMQSAWLMTVMVGNLIDIIIVELKFFDKQWKEFFLFAGLMFVDMVIFSYLAYRYTSADLTKSTDFAHLDDKNNDDDDDDASEERKGGKENLAYDNDKDD